MTFPTWQQFAECHQAAIVGFAILVIISITFWGMVVLRQSIFVSLLVRKFWGGKQGIVIVAGGTTFFAILCVLWMLLASNSFLRYRFDPAQVTEFRVQQIVNIREGPVGKIISITDPVILQTGLRALIDAKYTSRSHQSYEGGYCIQIRLMGEPAGTPRFLMVYRLSNTDRWVAVVMPLWGSDSYEVSDIGMFRSEIFADWIEREITPLFDKQ